MTSNYGFGKTLSTDFDTAIDQVTEALKTEGFGVLTDIDIQATMAKTLDVEMKAYRILGACNPALANQALSNDPSIGLLLPCNVVVRETDDGVRVEFMDPSAVLGLVNSDEVAVLAAQVRKRLERVRVRDSL